MVYQTKMASGFLTRILSNARARMRVDDRKSRLYRNHQDELKDRAIDLKVYELLLQYARNREEMRRVVNMLTTEVRTSANRKFAASYHSVDEFKLRQEEFLSRNGMRMHAHGNPYYLNALEQLRKELPVKAWTVSTPQSEDEIVQLIPELSTSAGYYGFLTGKSKVCDNLEVICNHVKTLIEAARNGDMEPWMMEVIIPETRHQVSEPFDIDGNLKPSDQIKEKTRFVWNCPKGVVILENMTEKDVFNRFLKHTNWYANGKDPHLRRELIRMKSAKFAHSITLDASSFDLHLFAEQIRDVRNVMKTAFLLSDEQEKIYDAVTYYYQHKPVFLNDEKVVIVENGMPSGMKGTNDNDSICFRIMIDTYFNHLGWRRDRDYSTIHDGDDVLLFFNKDLDYDDMCGYLKHNFDLILDPNKYANNDRCPRGVFFNKKYFGSNLGEWRHPFNLLARAVFPEQKRDHAYYSGRVRASDIVIAYILTYYVGMWELIDVSTFMRDHKIDIDRLQNSDLRTLPGAVRLLLKGY